MTGGRVVVLGGSGSLGALVVADLRARGREVVVASRGTGVDAVSGSGLDAALAGAEVVVDDCVNFQTLSKRRAVEFFSTTARHVAGAATRSGVARIVVLSIVNTTEPQVRSALGYYAGKGAQEDTYRAGTVPVTAARTTQWFSLGRQFLHQLRIGPVAFVPQMQIRPVDPRAAAAFVAEQTLAPSPPEVVSLAGPQVMGSADLARHIADAEAPGTRVVSFPMPVRALRGGGLLPGPDVRVDATTLDAWLAAEQAAPGRS